MDAPRYREWPATGADAAFLSCTWAQRAGTARDILVLPDGCVDIVWESDGRLHVAGPDLGPFVHHQAPGVEVVGVRLRPGTAGTVLGLQVDGIRDLRLELDAVWGGAAARLVDRLASSGSTAERRHALAAAVRDVAVEAPLDAPVLAAARALVTADAGVAQVADAVGLDERRLRRRFARQVGYGPKTFQRVVRFRRFLDLAADVAARVRTVGQVAATAGYADHAHLVRECRALTGRTPTEVVAAWHGDVRFDQDGSAADPVQ